MLGILLLMAIISALLMRFANSRQWLIALMVLPLLGAGVAWAQQDMTMAFFYYGAGIFGFFMPLDKTFWWFYNLRKVEKLDIREMWCEPFNIIDKIWRRKSKNDIE